jgi:NDP-sugar pyrophosphorylase family protein
MPAQGETLGILAGAMGTRLAEETDNHPKPMVEIVAQPMISDCQFR